MTEAPHLEVSEEDNILIATFNRPEKYNALSISLMRALGEAVEYFRDSPHLKVMLVRAKGKYFSAGADLKEGSGGAPLNTGSALREMHRRLPTRMRQIWDEIEHVEKPFVVAHQGPCVGGSLEMSLSCDFRLAAASASYAFPEAKFGVLPATNGVSRLTRIVGPHWARYFIMANKPVNASQALNMGLVHEVYPDETFQEDAMAFCRHLAKQNGEVMGTAKITIEMAWDLGADQAAAAERMANATLMMNPDYLENMRKHLATVGTKKG
jgi:enoyl-CoA hydratase